MADRIVFFGTIKSIELDVRDTVAVTLDGEQRLTAPKELRPVLEELLERQWPVYFEAGELLDIVLARLPRVVRVVSVEGNSVTFHQSQVRAEAADDAVLSELRRALETRASLAVTITDAFKVVHAVPYSPLLDASVPATLVEPAAFEPDDCVPPGRAQELFDLCAGFSCEPRVPRPPCIPFLYPDDGCWARAHDMARLIIAAGARPMKVWIYGKLLTQTDNNPCCFVKWRFHVAPTICVRAGRSRGEVQVIDPSLFKTPVPVAKWASVQGDPDATFASTAADIYWNVDMQVEMDPRYKQTNWWLAHFRLQLRLRSLTSGVGPPPYVCPPPHPCV